MSEFRVFEIGEDGGRWLVVGQNDLLREPLNIDAARLAVIEFLRGQLMPGDEVLFAETVACVLDELVCGYEYPIYVDPASERVYVESPLGEKRAGERLGSCGVAVGFTLPTQHDVEDLVDLPVRRSSHE